MKVWCERGNLAFPLSELQAAVLLPQWEKLFLQNAQRRQAVARLTQQPLPHWEPRIACTHRGDPCYYKVAWRLTAAADKQIGRERMLSALWQQRLPFDVGFRGFTNRSTRRCRKPLPLPESERAAAATILLHHPVLLQSGSVLAALDEATRAVLNSWPTEP